jgi:phage I-like protein
MKLTAVALLTAALALQAAAEVQLLPAGEFTGRDGRPGKGLTWKLADDKGRALAAKLNARHATVHFNLDYEHQAMLTETNGQPAPASGWGSKFEWRDGQGLFVLDMQWTAKAGQMIEDKEYKYLSPVIVYDKRTGEITDVINAALTNIPNLDINPVAQERIERLNANFSPTEIDSMNAILKALLIGLGLPATDATTEAQATAALTSLQTARSDLTALLKSLGVVETTDAATATTAIATLKAKADKAGGAATDPDPTKWVSLDNFNTLSAEVAALRASGVHREVDELVAQATADGKCAGVVADVWRDVGKKDIAQLRALIEKTPANPALAGQRQTDKNKPAGGDGGDTLSVDEIAVCSATGITREDFLKTRKAAAAATA